MADFTLPDLTYDYAALEPHISAQIMELHHSKHHATYVKGANTAVEALAEARDNAAYAAIGTLEKNLAFHLGGHLNHSVFWTNMSPDGGGEPDGDLASVIDEHFGSFEKFRAHFDANALAVQGSGWSVLAWDTISQRPFVFQLQDQQGNVPICTVPLLMLDMWEHAYYLQVSHDKAAYVGNWWNVVSWADVQARLDRARSQTVGLVVA